MQVEGVELNGMGIASELIGGIDYLDDERDQRTLDGLLMPLGINDP